MPSFADCPNCADDEDRYSAECPCPECGGSMRRAVTKENVQLAETAKEWLDEEISNLFRAYCSAHGIHVAYGVDRYDIGHKTIRIVQDISARSCYNTTDHEIPTELLYMTDEDRKARFATDVQRKKEEADQKARQDAIRELAALEARTAALRNKLA